MDRFLFVCFCLFYSFSYQLSLVVFRLLKYTIVFVFTKKNAGRRRIWLFTVTMEYYELNG